MLDVKKLSPVQLDALREIANIGSAHAATSLSELLGRQVMIRVPTFLVGQLKDVTSKSYKPDSIVASVLMTFLGDITGKALILYPSNDAKALTSMAMPVNIAHDDKLQESSLKEISNILLCSYMNSLGELLGFLILPSVPAITVDLAGRILSKVLNEFTFEEDLLFCIETEFNFGDAETQLHAFLLLLPDTIGVEHILRELKLLE